ncbi:MAG: TAXI family TRAP transporter solute-binding subunit [Syntrophales bacterium]
MKASADFFAAKLRSMSGDILGFGRTAKIAAACLVSVALASATFLFFYLAPPDAVVMTGGPKGSGYERTAQKYAKILKRNGITLRVLNSEGSGENIRRLADPASKVDIGFVQSGFNKGVESGRLVSLGSTSYQPLFVFYRNPSEIGLLSGFAGKRLGIGEVGSGTHSLSLLLLGINGIKPGGPTTMLEMDSDRAAQAILDGKLDCVFLMGDSVSSELIRRLLHTPGIRLFDFTQADAYMRRIRYLNKITLPKGSIDFGKNTPPHDISLVAATVELIAREDLHPALSDLLLEAAREIHSGASLFRQKGEFPAPLEQEIRISEDASRYYKSGKTFLYRYLPFRLASFVNRILVVLVPMIVLLLPGLRIIPSIYRWRFKSRIFRWYNELMMIEKNLLEEMASDERRRTMEKLDSIERAVHKMKVPASFADQFYILREHINFVRARLLSEGARQARN